MFLVEITYPDLGALEAVLAEHRAWLDELYDAGYLLASGPMEPRSGGIMIGVAESRAEFESVCATDPFVVHGVAEHRIVEFRATKVGPHLEEFRQR